MPTPRPPQVGFRAPSDEWADRVTALCVSTGEDKTTLYLRAITAMVQSEWTDKAQSIFDALPKAPTDD